MSKITGEEVTLGQENGPDVRLVVYGDEFYARYETPDGYPAIYDEDRGLFCYAFLEDGRYASTGVPVTDPPPTGVERHAQESAAVRQEKSSARLASRTAPPEQIA
jgi:hypothetical protein